MSASGIFMPQSNAVTDAYGNYKPDPNRFFGGGGLGQFAPTETQVAQDRVNLERDKLRNTNANAELLLDGPGRRQARDEGRPYSAAANPLSRGADGDKPRSSNTLASLFDLLGLGNEGVSGSSRRTVGDVSEETGDTLSPLLAALQSMFGTQTGADVAFGSQAIQKLLGQESNANNRFQTETQQKIADNANTEAARAQAAQYAEAETRAQSNLDRFNQLGAGRPRNPMARGAAPSSSELTNSMMNRGAMPPMFA